MLPRKMTIKQKERLEQSLRQETENILAVIWAMSENESFESLARRAGLSPATIYRLWGGLYVRPQFLTFQKLGRAVGLKITFARDGVSVALDDLTVVTADDVDSVAA